MGLVYWGLTPQQHPGLRVEGLREWVWFGLLGVNASATSRLEG